MSVRLSFLGGAATVTGSKTLVESDDARVLIDCGLFQGFKQLRELNWRRPPVDPKHLDAVLLTHAHIDHSGYLPLLVKHGYRGRITASDGTVALCGILLPDTAHLQEEEAERANRYGSSRHAPALPLYTQGDVDVALRRLDAAPLDTPFEPAPGVTASLHRAGHILGATMVRLALGGTSVVFSGDVGRRADPLVGAPAPLPPCDTLVLESTYGNRRHADVDPADELADVVNRTVARGGVVVVPTFAVGRAQTVLLHLHRLREAGRIPHHVPIFLDSPLATKATAVFRRLVPTDVLSAAECAAICALPRFVETAAESAALSARRGPAIVLAGSGMATGGRVVHHLKAFAPDPNNAVLFTGFQAGGTRGDRLVRGESFVRIFGEDVPVRCEVAQLDNLSAHADADELIAWLKEAPSLPRRILLNHGSPESCDALRVRLRRELSVDASVPNHGDVVELGD